MRVLVLGSGGREHALVWAIARSPRVEEVICAPGSDGIALDGRSVPVDLDDLDAVVALAQRERVDLVVVGPEDPLARGVVDRLEAAGIATFGPNAAAAQLEASKAFAKEFMGRHGIPTAAHCTFDDADAADRYVDERGGPLVVKADGLAAGKGVFVCDHAEGAHEAIDEIMRAERFGKSGARVVLEERLIGEEISYYALSDGEDFVILPCAQDYKRILDGDRGENTGGMGAYSPPPIADERMRGLILERVLRPTLDGMRAEGRPYRGVLYVGLIVVDDEPYVIEFNSRFGDPETQPILFRLEADLVPLFEGCARGDLRGFLERARLESGSGDGEALAVGGELGAGHATVCVVLASKGYPRSYPTGLAIDGLAECAALPDVQVFHAGTEHTESGWTTAGGRVLGVTARGATLEQARDRAYDAAARIHFEGVQYRRDVAAIALGGPAAPRRGDADS